jgi:hypothetical protein
MQDKGKQKQSNQHFLGENVDEENKENIQPTSRRPSAPKLQQRIHQAALTFLLPRIHSKTKSK